MKKTAYNFRETASFLNDSVTLDELYDDVITSMRHLSTPNRFLTKKRRAEIWRTLLTCADFLDTIVPK